MIIYNGTDNSPDPYSQQVDEAVSCAIRHIGIATYSSGKIKAFLMNKGFSDNVAEDAVAELISRQYIDDTKAAGKVLRYRTGKKQESRAYIFKRLIEAGISEDTANRICEELPSDKETCVILYESLDIAGDPSEHREEYISIASRRGYSYEHASSAFDEFLS